MPEVLLYLVIAVLVIGAIWAYLTAQRLDRLHRKVFASRTALDTQLAHRGAVSAQLAASGILDPASSVLIGQAAWDSLAAGGHGHDELAAALPELARTPPLPGGHPAGAMALARASAESELSSVWRDVLSDSDTLTELQAHEFSRRLLADLAAAWQRVQIARRFHNESVVQARQLRRTVLVRMLGLAGHAALPAAVEFDDVRPPGLDFIDIAGEEG